MGELNISRESERVDHYRNCQIFPNAEKGFGFISR